MKQKDNDHAATAPVAPAAMPRRKFVTTYGTAIAGLSVTGLAGCTGGETTSSSSQASSSAAQSSSLASSSSSAIASSSEAASSSAQAVEGWARGGTQSLWANFPPPSPFGNASPAICQQATGRQILGPCFFREADFMRQDISEGVVGLPTVFGFKVMDRNCNPLPGVIVELWHTNCEGLYSDDRSNSVEQSPNYWDGSGFLGLSCADNNARAMTKAWHRGGQMTDGDGIVYFKSCFPYWYAGRTTHIHIRFIRESDGQELLTTQFGFSDALCNDIHLNHPEYSHVDENGGRQQDTSMSGDIEFGGAGDEWILETQRQQDGSLLAYKNIIIA